jgi:very-short-patch-repair endonuclease
MKKTSLQPNDMLLAIFKYKISLTTLKEQGWYHIPVARAPKSFKTAHWMCFYQGKIFEKEAYRVQYYGEMDGYEVVPYRNLFPNQFENPKSNLPYYKVHLKELRELSEPIPSIRPRRLSFIPTTFAKFESATQINDLFNDSPLENILWAELKKQDIYAERQWWLPFEKQSRYLDFAIFCNDGFVDMETDGDTYHTNISDIKNDNERNNQLAQKGWRVLRFNGDKILSDMGHCIREVNNTINTLKGLTDDGLVPRMFIKEGESIIQQLSMFEGNVQSKTINKNYDSGATANLET